MKRSLVTAFTCGVWLSAAASAAALTYELDRPLVPSTPAVSATEPSSPPLTASVSNVSGERASDVLEITAVTIVGDAIRPVRRTRSSPSAAPRDISTMSCAGWRDLDIGSGRVQVCQ